jgi:hypothetical protein
VSPCNFVVFSAPEKGDFSKNYDALKFVGKIPFVCACTGPVG